MHPLLQSCICLKCIVAIYSYYNEIISTVVICNPSCVNGACIANDTCQCGMGYTGQICTEPGEPAIHGYILIILSHILYSLH